MGLPTRTQVCIATSQVHLLAMGVTTYIASKEIETILVSGPICAVTGIVAAVSAGILGRTLLALANAAAPIIAVTLFVLEAFFLHLGPGRAAAPFMVVFLLNQAISLPVILLQLRQVINRTRDQRQQISLRALMVTTAVFAALFAMVRVLLEQSDHSVWMAVALALLGLTVGGQILFLYFAIFHRDARRSAISLDDDKTEASGLPD